MQVHTEQKKTVLHAAIAALLAVLTTLAFGRTARWTGAAVLDEVPQGLSASTGFLLFTAAALFFFYYFTLRGGKLQRHPLAIVSALLFGVANLLGRSMHYVDSLAVLFDGPLQGLLSLLYVVGFAALFFFLLQWLPRLTAAVGGKEGKTARFFERYAFFKALTVLFVAYLPWIAAFYPGCTVADLYLQLDFYFNGAASFAPVFSSTLAGICLRVGIKLGSEQFGLFLFLAIQVAVCLIACASVIEAMVRLRLHRAAVWGALACYALLPIFPAYSMIASKDPIFAAFLLLFLSRAAVLLLGRDGERCSLFDAVLLFGAALGAALFRNGGVWLIVVGAVGLLLFLRGKTWRRAAAAIGCALLLFFLWDGVFLPSKGVLDAPRSESLSIPFQQVARCVKQHGDDLTDAEIAAIDAVLEYDALAASYEPLLSDGVKGTYKLFNTPEEDVHLAEFFRVWRLLLVRYPVTCLESLVGNSYGYYAFTPPTRVLGYNQNNGMCLFLQTSPFGTEHYPQWDFSMLPMFSGLRQVLKTAAEGASSLPVLHLLTDCAFHCWLLAALFVHLLMQKRYRRTVIFLPVLVMMIACIASPVNDCFRYFFAVVMASPLLLAVCAAREEK